MSLSSGKNKGKHLNISSDVEGRFVPPPPKKKLQYYTLLSRSQWPRVKGVGLRLLPC
jgi:hypothetical protein